MLVENSHIIIGHEVKKQMRIIHPGLAQKINQPKRINRMTFPFYVIKILYFTNLRYYKILQILQHRQLWRHENFLQHSGDQTVPNVCH